MQEVKENFSLKDLNTFHFDVYASGYIKADSIEHIKSWLSKNKPALNDILIMGGGSNLLFTSNYEGTIIHPAFDSITITEQNKEEVFVEAGAGMVWDEFVKFCVKNSFFGVENLSLIPGTVGAAPVQNIGAYGTEAKDVIEKVNGIFLDTGKGFSLNKNECNFGYRNSIFKKGLKNRVLITSVVFRLTKKERFHLKYGLLEDKVKQLGEVNISNVRRAVIDIRRAKLPDPDHTGNAGSFFKNPEIPEDQFAKLKDKYQEMPGYVLGNGKVKVPAGWLIDKAGWKGKNIGNAGVHPDQALVLINHGNATGKEILHLASEIEKDINNKFGIKLEKEVIVI